MSTPVPPARSGHTGQSVTAGRDAYTAGRDQHFHITLAPSVRAVAVLLAALVAAGVGLASTATVHLGSSLTVRALVGVLAVLAAVAAVVVAGVVVWTRRRPGRTLGPQHLAGLKADLARQARREWAREWHTRMRFPPLAVEWSVPAGLEAGAGDLPRSGTTADVLPAFTRQPPARRRLVVVGAGGSGKTVLALQLTLGMIDAVADWGGPAPVPVYVPAALWDPTSQDLRGWLVERVAQDYAGFDTVVVDEADGRSKTVAGLLFDHGALLPVLDGFDEMGPRNLAAEALLDADLPFVLTSRPAEFDAAAAWLRGQGRAFDRTPVVGLLPLTADDAVVDYISAGSPPRRAGAWERVRHRLRAEPDGPLARALSTPLMVALARTVHGPADRGPEPLLEAPDAESYLLDAFFASVYDDRLRSVDTERRERDRPHHRGDRPLRWLGFLASRTRRTGRGTLAWWELRGLAAPLVLETAWGAAAGAAAALLLVPLGWRGLGVVAGPCLGLLLGAAFDLAYASVRQARSADRSVGGFRTRLDLPTIGRWLATGSFVVAVALAAGAAVLAASAAAGWRAPAAPPARADTAVLGLLIAVVVAVAAGMVIGLVAGAALSRPAVEKRVATVRAATPTSTLARDRTASLALTAMFGVAVGFASGAGTAVAFGGDLGMGGWAAGTALVPGGVAAAMMFTAWTPYVPVLLWLAARGRLPLRLATFLADARRWEVLRQFGAHYQFRHEALRRHLAAGYEADRAAGGRVRGG
ncbi:hypothetical protein ACFPZ0_05320 [Streptomonospora nanhaiensis]|uniref:NACHT domain-containing protein n=1 Tax=Streptomonospora nanhaiensis TaxID=1323731 RepID=A0A853BGM0_9ACTN|nr:hypothetical protein [Streptomonospora nanhaiensis]MBV2365033.1 ATP-binding protein [Streptomonospora nanhaiensis]MBX9388298.1 ATP-binding protein [Streptomonospora nanhaiensis]NYI94509.1 hypothetical protein [Streptomonospora nanhaiensis]